VRFTRTMSCDSLLLLFDEFARGERKRREREEEERREVLQRLFSLPTQTHMPTTPPLDGATIHDCLRRPDHHHRYLPTCPPRS